MSGRRGRLGVLARTYTQREHVLRDVHAATRDVRRWNGRQGDRFGIERMAGRASFGLAFHATVLRGRTWPKYGRTCEGPGYTGHLGAGVLEETGVSLDVLVVPPAIRPCTVVPQEAFQGGRASRDGGCHTFALVET